MFQNNINWNDGSKETSIQIAYFPLVSCSDAVFKRKKPEKISSTRSAYKLGRPLWQN
jgi:hypothetical protein